MIERQSSPDQPTSALAFKIMTDPYVGRLTYVRVYSGKIDAGSYLLNPTSDVKERIARLLRMHANKREDIKTAYAGDIVAVIGLSQDDDRRHSVRSRSIRSYSSGCRSRNRW